MYSLYNPSIICVWLCFSGLWSGSIGHSVADKKLSAFAQRLPRLSCGSFRTPHRGASTYLVQVKPFDKACGSRETPAKPQQSLRTAPHCSHPLPDAFYSRMTQSDVRKKEWRHSSAPPLLARPLLLPGGVPLFTAAASTVSRSTVSPRRLL